MQGGGLVWWESWCLWAGLTTLVLVGFHGRKGGVVADVRRSVGAFGTLHPYCPAPGGLVAPVLAGAGVGGGEVLPGEIPDRPRRSRQRRRLRAPLPSLEALVWTYLPLPPA